MACFSPLKGYRGPGGTVKFSHPGAWVDQHLVMACGQCWGCRLERSRQWAVRCLHEAQTHEKNSFITLTFDDEHVPADNSLDVKTWQKFAKRLRKKIGPFRFYHCGEYGDNTARCHYHAALFGVDFVDDQVFYRLTRNGNKLYNSPTLDEAWPDGYAVIGDLTFESAAYVARYCMKKLTGKKAKEPYSRVNKETGEVFENLTKEYATMSRRPGIGKSWFDQYVTDVYPDDFVVINGKKARPPKYYDGQYEISDPESLRLLKAGRRKAGRKHSKNNTPERLKVRENIAIARMKHFGREVE